ncbi:ribonuclease T2-like protein [Podospora appendiculata]|uniref:ribonuclease T2 n=1 Tax=Podospora appendiculata TaxID=314037 RepID=A0AAE1CA93_9PEZI|nr:ribonuclease T2-like protein [Podospora appendiculata]
MASSSLRAIVSYAANVWSQLPFSGNGPSSFDVQPSSSSFYEPLSGAPSCPFDGPMSCHNSTPIAGEDSCCFVYPGGRILLTQFWDPQVYAVGAEEDWTLHGLWPDLCDGTYDQFCHMTPRYENVTAVLEEQGQHQLLEFMDRFWLASSGPNSRLWNHEFNKHATCINTLAPSCYGSSGGGSGDEDSNAQRYTPGAEVVDYFTRASALFNTLDTYSALRKAGIVPQARKHYPLADVQKALEIYSGGRVVLRCTGRRDVLHEAWYVYYVKGSLQTGEFVPAQHLGREEEAGNCAPWVKYLPKKGVAGEEEEEEEEEFLGDDDL